MDGDSTIIIDQCVKGKSRRIEKNMFKTISYDFMPFKYAFLVVRVLPKFLTFPGENFRASTLGGAKPGEHWNQGGNLIGKSRFSLTEIGHIVSYLCFVLMFSDGYTASLSQRPLNGFKVQSWIWGSGVIRGASS